MVTFDTNRISIQNVLFGALQERESLLKRLDLLNGTIFNCRIKLDTINTIPHEIWQYIFICALPTEGEERPQLDFTRPPLLFSRVCHMWRDISFATHELWTTISMFIPAWGTRKTYSYLDSAFHDWLIRAGDRPLSIYLSGSEEARIREESEFLTSGTSDVVPSPAMQPLSFNSAEDIDLDSNPESYCTSMEEPADDCGYDPNLLFLSTAFMFLPRWQHIDFGPIILRDVDEIWKSSYKDQHRYAVPKDLRTLGANLLHIPVNSIMLDIIYSTNLRTLRLNGGDGLAPPKAPFIWHDLSTLTLDRTYDFTMILRTIRRCPNLVTLDIHFDSVFLDYHPNAFDFAPISLPYLTSMTFTIICDSPVNHSFHATLGNLMDTPCLEIYRLRSTESGVIPEELPFSPLRLGGASLETLELNYRTAHDMRYWEEIKRVIRVNGDTLRRLVLGGDTLLTSEILFEFAGNDENVLCPLLEELEVDFHKQHVFPEHVADAILQLLRFRTDPTSKCKHLKQVHFGLPANIPYDLYEDELRKAGSSIPECKFVVKDSPMMHMQLLDL